MTEITVQHPSGAAFEAKFRSHGVKFTYVDEFTLEDCVGDKTVQVRAAGMIAPGKRVDRYVEQMRAGAKFPPIVIRAADNVLLDGNTRVAAASSMGMVSLPAYLVETTTAVQARKLAGALNQMGAADLLDEEVRRLAKDAKASGESDAWIAREYGVDYTKVRRWMQMDAVQEHCERLQLDDEFDRLTQNQAVVLEPVSRDAPFAALVRGVAGHKPPAAELRHLVQDVQKAPSDEEAVAKVAEAVQGWPEQEDGGRRSTKKSPAMSANSGIGMLLRRPAVDYVDLAVREQQLPKWVEVRDLAQQVIDGYGDA